jgi:hypothetical protein
MAALMGTGALALWIDVDPNLDRETDAWYIVEHMPERIDIGGYRRARRFQALEGAPRYLTLFEADTPDALASPGYLALVGSISEQSKRIRAGFSNVARNTFQVRATHGRGLGAVVASLRLRIATSGDGKDDGRHAATARAWLAECLSRLATEHGIVGTHWLEADPQVRARMDAVRVTGLSDGYVEHAVLVEATREHDLRALRSSVLSASALAHAGWTEDAYGVYALLYEVSGP